MKKLIGTFLYFCLIILSTNSICYSQKTVVQNYSPPQITSLTNLNFINKKYINSDEHNQIFYDPYHLLLDPASPERYKKEDSSSYFVLCLPPYMKVSKLSSKIIYNDKTDDSTFIFDIEVDDSVGYYGKHVVTFEAVTEYKLSRKCDYIGARILLPEDNALKEKTIYPIKHKFDTSDNEENIPLITLRDILASNTNFFNKDSLILIDVPDSSSFNAVLTEFSKVTIGPHRYTEIKSVRTKTIGNEYHIIIRAENEILNIRKKFRSVDIPIRYEDIEDIEYYVVTIHHKNGKKEKRVLKAKTKDVPFEEYK